MNTLRKQVLCAALLGLSTLASATTSMTANGSAFQIAIADLTPDDGIAAGLSNLTYTNKVFVSAKPEVPDGIEAFASAVQPVAVASDTAWVSAAAASTGQIGDFQLRLDSTDLFQQRQGPEEWLHAYVSSYVYFSIAPHTEITLTGHVTFTADLAFDTETVDTIFGYHAECSAYRPCARMQHFYDEPGSHTSELDIEGVFRNTSDQYRDGWIASFATMHTTVNRAVVPEVPEPATGMLLALGIPVAAWAARWRGKVPMENGRTPSTSSDRKPGA